MCRLIGRIDSRATFLFEENILIANSEREKERPTYSNVTLLWSWELSYPMGRQVGIPMSSTTDR